MTLETNELSKIVNRVQMPEKLLKTTELALFRSVGQQIFDQSKKGEWINSASKKIIKSSDRELKKMDYISDSDSKTIENYLDKFFKLTGWVGKTKNASTAIIFCLDLYEKSKFKYNSGLKKNLNSVLEYNKKNSGVPAACKWGGKLAWQKWDSLIN